MFKFVCDLETTGLDPISNDVIELCILVINNQNEVVEKFLSRVQPEINERTWSLEAQKVHGFTPEQAASFPSRRSVCIKIMHFFKKYLRDETYPFICHASPDKFFDLEKNEWSWPHIDYHFLYWMFYKEGLQYSFLKMFSSDKIISTVTMAREFSRERFGHKLNIWAKKIGFELNHHNAESDALCCLELYKYFEGQQCINLENTKQKQSTSLESEFKLVTQELSPG